MDVAEPVKRLKLHAAVADLLSDLLSPSEVVGGDLMIAAHAVHGAQAADGLQLAGAVADLRGDLQSLLVILPRRARGRLASGALRPGC